MDQFATAPYSTLAKISCLMVCLAIGQAWGQTASVTNSTKTPNLIVQNTREQNKPAYDWTYALAQGRALAKVGKFGEAIPLLRQANAEAQLQLKAQPDNAQYKHQYFATNRDLGAALVMNGEAKLALKHLGDALKTKASDPTCLQLRATAFGQLRRWRRANRDLDKYLLQHPYNDTAWVNKGSVMEHRKKYQEAGNAYEQAIRINPNCVPAQLGLATLLARQGQYQDALPVLARLAQHNPNNKSIQLNRALALYHTESLTAAAEAFSKVLSLDKTSTQALTLRGVCYYRLRNQYAACRDWTKAASLGDDDAASALKKYCDGKAMGIYKRD